MNIVMYGPILWMMMELNPPTGIWAFFWVALVFDATTHILKSIAGSQV